MSDCPKYDPVLTLATVPSILQTCDQVPPRHPILRPRRHQTGPRYSSGEGTAQGWRRQRRQEERTSRTALGYDMVIMGRLRLLRIHRLPLDVSCVRVLVHSAHTVPDRF